MHVVYISTVYFWNWLPILKYEIIAYLIVVVMIFSQFANELLTGVSFCNYFIWFIHDEDIMSKNKVPIHLSEPNRGSYSHVDILSRMNYAPSNKLWLHIHPFVCNCLQLG